MTYFKMSYLQALRNLADLFNNSITPLPKVLNEPPMITNKNNNATFNKPSNLPHVIPYGKEDYKKQKQIRPATHQ